MKTFISALSTILLSLLFTGSMYAQDDEEKVVRDAFDGYKSNILNDKGKEAAKYVDSRTIAYYNDIAQKCRTADSASVRALNIMDKLMVFSIRHRAEASDIKSFDGTGLLVYAINSGMVGKSSVVNNSIGEVTIEKDFAKGQLVVSGTETPIYFHFYQEGGDWKVDLTSIFEMSTMAFDQMVKGSGQDENEFLFSVLEQLTGRAPDNGIWHPVK